MSNRHRKLYESKEWRALRKTHLREQPVCEYCLRTGFHNDGSRRATGEPIEAGRRRVLVVDHIIPHRGDIARFLDPNNLQTLCPQHHDGDKQILERRGYNDRIGDDGWPLDPIHPGNIKSPV